MTKFTPIKLAYSVFESKSGSDVNLTPVIFLHELTACKEIWESIPQIIANKTRRKVYSYDARNHGDSEYTHDFNMDLLIEDLFHFMDERSIQKAILIGYNMGGFVSASAALINHERVEMVILEEMMIGKISEDFLSLAIQSLQLRKESIQQIPKDMEEEEAAAFIIEYLSTRLPHNHPWRRMMKKENLKKMNIRLKRRPDGGYDLGFNVDAIIQGMKDPENFSKDPCGVFDGPAYFLYGNKSPLRSKEYEENIKKHFPRAEFIEFDEATHNIHIEYTDKFIDAILSRIQS